MGRLSRMRTMSIEEPKFDHVWNSFVHIAATIRDLGVDYNWNLLDTLPENPRQAEINIRLMLVSCIPESRGIIPIYDLNMLHKRPLHYLEWLYLNRKAKEYGNYKVYEKYLLYYQDHKIVCSSLNLEELFAQGITIDGKTLTDDEAEHYITTAIIRMEALGHHPIPKFNPSLAYKARCKFLQRKSPNFKPLITPDPTIQTSKNTKNKQTSSVNKRVFQFQDDQHSPTNNAPPFKKRRLNSNTKPSDANSNINGQNENIHTQYTPPITNEPLLESTVKIDPTDEKYNPPLQRYCKPAKFDKFPTYDDDDSDEDLYRFESINEPKLSRSTTTYSSSNHNNQNNNQQSNKSYNVSNYSLCDTNSTSDQNTANTPNNDTGNQPTDSQHHIGSRILKQNPNQSSIIINIMDTNKNVTITNQDNLSSVNITNKIKDTCIGHKSPPLRAIRSRWRQGRRFQSVSRSPGSHSRFSTRSYSSPYIRSISPHSNSSSNRSRRRFNRRPRYRRVHSSHQTTPPQATHLSPTPNTRTHKGSIRTTMGNPTKATSPTPTDVTQSKPTKPPMAKYILNQPTSNLMGSTNNVTKNPTNPNQINEIQHLVPTLDTRIPPTTNHIYTVQATSTNIRESQIVIQREDSNQQTQMPTMDPKIQLRHPTNPTYTTSQTNENLKGHKESMAVHPDQYLDTLICEPPRQTHPDPIQPQENTYNPTSTPTNLLAITHQSTFIQPPGSPTQTRSNNLSTGEPTATNDINMPRGLSEINMVQSQDNLYNNPRYDTPDTDEHIPSRPSPINYDSSSSPSRLWDESSSPRRPSSTPSTSPLNATPSSQTTNTSTDGPMAAIITINKSTSKPIYTTEDHHHSSQNLPTMTNIQPNENPIYPEENPPDRDTGETERPLINIVQAIQRNKWITYNLPTTFGPKLADVLYQNQDYTDQILNSLDNAFLQDKWDRSQSKRSLLYKYQMGFYLLLKYVQLDDASEYLLHAEPLKGQTIPAIILSNELCVQTTTTDAPNFVQHKIQLYDPKDHVFHNIIYPMDQCLPPTAMVLAQQEIQQLNGTIVHFKPTMRCRYYCSQILTVNTTNDMEWTTINPTPPQFLSDSEESETDQDSSPADTGQPPQYPRRGRPTQLNNHINGDLLNYSTNHPHHTQVEIGEFEKHKDHSNMSEESTDNDPTNPQQHHANHALLYQQPTPTHLRDYKYLYKSLFSIYCDISRPTTISMKLLCFIYENWCRYYNSTTSLCNTYIFTNKRREWDCFNPTTTTQQICVTILLQFHLFPYIGQCLQNLMNNNEFTYQMIRDLNILYRNNLHFNQDPLTMIMSNSPHNNPTYSIPTTRFPSLRNIPRMPPEAQQRILHRLRGNGSMTTRDLSSYFRPVQIYEPRTHRRGHAFVYMDPDRRDITFLGIDMMRLNEINENKEENRYEYIRDGNRNRNEDLLNGHRRSKKLVTLPICNSGTHINICNNIDLNNKHMFLPPKSEDISDCDIPPAFEPNSFINKINHSSPSNFDPNPIHGEHSPNKCHNHRNHQHHIDKVHWDLLNIPIEYLRINRQLDKLFDNTPPHKSFIYFILLLIKLIPYILISFIFIILYYLNPLFKPKQPHREPTPEHAYILMLKTQNKPKFVPKSEQKPTTRKPTRPKSTAHKNPYAYKKTDPLDRPSSQIVTKPINTQVTQSVDTQLSIRNWHIKAHIMLPNGEIQQIKLFADTGATIVALNARYAKAKYPNLIQTRRRPLIVWTAGQRHLSLRDFIELHFINPKTGKTITIIEAYLIENLSTKYLASFYLLNKLGCKFPTTPPAYTEHKPQIEDDFGSCNNWEDHKIRVPNVHKINTNKHVEFTLQQTVSAPKRVYKLKDVNLTNSIQNHANYYEKHKCNKSTLKQIETYDEYTMMTPYDQYHSFH